MKRRSLLQGLAMVPLAMAAGNAVDVHAQLAGPQLTVTGLEVFRVKVNRRGNWTIVRLQTSGGVTGIGEASQSGKDEANLKYLQQFFDLLKGRSI
jgi:L-alanine-DL-glutamate epimerase-like enolase superfamily enzyme